MIITTEEKILLANTKAKELLTVLSNSGPVVVNSKTVAPIDQLLDLLGCAVVFAKYTELDLEATQREREFFRNQASNQG